MELTRVSHSDLDISSEAEVLSYDYTGADPTEIMARVDLGNDLQPLSGDGGVYTLRIYIDDVLVTPESAVTVPAGKARTIMVSRAVPIESGDTIQLKVVGLAGDTAISTIASLRDVTPLRAEDLQGGGSVLVDHDYGGPDNLRVVSDAGAGIESAVITAYLESDYLAGDRGSEFVRGRALTDVNGRWREPLMLDPETYVLVISRHKLFNATTKTIEVS